MSRKAARTRSALEDAGSATSFTDKALLERALRIFRALARRPRSAAPTAISGWNFSATTCSAW